MGLSIFFWIIAICGSLGVLAWQVLGWLKTGVWRAISLTEAIEWLVGKPVTRKPTGWIGFEHILDYLAAAPFSLTLFVVCALLALMFSSAAKH